MKIKKLLLALAGAAASIAASAATYANNRVVFIGDSITAQSVRGYGFGRAMQSLVPGVEFVSLGWSGQTLAGWVDTEQNSRGGTGNYGTVLQEAEAPTYYVGTELDKAADYVFIMLGMNDLLKPTTYDTPESLAQWKANLKTFAQNIRAREAGRNAKICLASVSLLMENFNGPKNLVLDKLAVAAQEVVAELGAGYVYVPIRERIKEQHLAGRAINPEYHLCLDHVHPVEDGHAVIAREYLSVMGETEGVANRNQYLADRMEWQRQNAPVNYVAPNPAPWLVSTKSFSLQHAWNYPVLDDSKAAGLVEAAIEGGATPETILSVDPTRLSAWTNVVATIDCFGGAGEGSICFNQIFNAGPYSAAYAARYIYSPTERVVTMNVTKENFTGCPYLAIWLNGVKVHFGQETSKSVTLKKGDNILFLRSSQPEWAWQQSVTFAASDTCPDVSDLEYGVAPSGNIDIGDATEFDEGRVKVSGASKIVCLSETDNEYVFTYRGSGAIEFSEAAKVDLLVVGGGGGGGAGGVRYVQGHSVAAGTYQVTVGTGGAGSEDQYTKGVNGGISSALNITAIGGGGGGTITTRDGVNGGSGGGACGLFGFWSEQQVGVPGEGSDGQGNAGGAGYTVPGMDNGIVSGGGGGAGSAGASATSTTALGYGGAGIACSITGSEVVYGGGGGGGRSESGGTIAGGLGGGGAGHGVDWNGTENAPTAGENGVDGLGGGGGGGGSAWSGGFAKGGNGGSGIVIIRYRRAASGGDDPVDPGDDPVDPGDDPEPVTAEGVTAVGATLAYAGEDPVFTFGTNGTITVAEDCVAAVLVVGGGGGGGSHGGGGGGACGVRFLDSYQLAAGTYQVTVGAGGTGSSSGYEPGADGAASSVFDIVAAGGGGGGSVYVRNGAAGGSGGGAAGTIGWQSANSGWQAGVQGSGTEGQGNAGGAGCVSGVEDWWHNSGGGGGAGGVGGSTSNGGELGFGGAGIPCRITGSRVYYGGGGGGGITGGGATVPGGVGGGGIGHGYDYLGQDEQNNPINVPHAGENGVDGLGGGGGGGGGFYHHNGANGGNGGSGVVIVRVLSGSSGALPVVDGVEKATPEAFLAVAKDGASVVLPAAFAWDGNVLKKDGEAWATLPSIYTVQNGAVVLDAAQVRPVVGADAQTTVDGIAVVDGAVKINVVNAKTGLYYGYRFATALGSLDTAPVTWRGESAAQDGDLLISAGDAGTTGFYRIVVGDRVPQN